MVTKLAIKNKKVDHLTFPVHTHTLKYSRLSKSEYLHWDMCSAP